MDLKDKILCRVSGRLETVLDDETNITAKEAKLAMDLYLQSQVQSIVDYKNGQRLKFNIYRTIIEGDFVKIENDRITIKTTKDKIKENIGKKQSINKDFLTL